MITPLYRQIAGFSIGTLQLDASIALCLLRWLFTLKKPVRGAMLIAELLILTHPIQYKHLRGSFHNY